MNSTLHTNPTKISALQALSFRFNSASAYNLQGYVDVSRNPDTQALAASMAIVQACHPYLAFRLTDHGLLDPGSPTPQILVARHYCKDIVERDEILSRELNKNFAVDDSAPGSVLVCQWHNNRWTIVFTLPHYLVDGTSTAALVIDVLTVYAELISGGSPHIEMHESVSLENAATPRGLDDDFSIMIPGTDLNEGVAPGTVPLKDRRSALLTETLESDTTRRLVGRCQDKGCSLDALISAACMDTMSEEIAQEVPRNKIAQRPKVSLLVVADQRRPLLKVHDTKRLGVASVVARVFRDALGEDESLWQLADRCANSLIRFQRKRGFFKSLLSLNWLRDLPDDRVLEAAESKDEHVMVSFLGDIGTIPGAEIFKKVGTESLGHSASTAFAEGTRWGMMVIAHVYQMRLTFSLNYTEPYWDRDRAARFGKRLKSTLEAAI